MTNCTNRPSRPALLTGAAGTLAAAGSLIGLLGAGCGGSGGAGAGSVTGTTTRAAATVNLYVTDGVADQWSHVQVTLYQIEVSSDRGASYTTAFSNTAGQSVDLASLGSAVQLLSSATVPAATITNVRVTLGDTVAVTSKADGTVQTVTVDNTLPNVTVANGHAAFTFAAATAMEPGKVSNLIVDFKLAAFELLSGKLRPSIGEGAPGAFDGKQVVAHISGTVSNYVAGSGFDLAPDCGRQSGQGNPGTPALLHVTLTPTTAVTSGIGSTATALANGLTVAVEGAPDATTHAVTATVVHIGNPGDSGPRPQPEPGKRPVRVMGTVASLGADGASFTVTVRDGDHLPPGANGVLTVNTNARTTFEQGPTPAAFSAVTVGSYIFTEGTLDPATGALTAGTVAVLPAAPAGQSWPGPPMGGPPTGGPLPNGH